MAPGNLSTDDLARDPDRSSSEPVRQPAGDDRVRVVRVGEATRTDTDTGTGTDQRTGTDERTSTDERTGTDERAGTDQRAGTGERADRRADERPDEARDLALLDERETQDFLGRWSDVQAQFVDDPKAAVRDGDSLVAELMQALAQRFSQHKGQLEEHWNSGGEPDTEDLRVALQRYRSFFQRLLST